MCTPASKRRRRNSIRRIAAGALAGAISALAVSFSTGASAQASSPPANAMVGSPKHVGTWMVSGWTQGYCAGERSLPVATGGVPLQFGVVRLRIGYRLVLISSGWELKPSTVLPIEFIAQPVFRSDASAVVAGPKAIVIDLGSDAAFLKKLATAPVIEIKGTQATFKLPLEGLANMLTELDSCYDALSRPMANPFAPAETETKKGSAAP